MKAFSMRGITKSIDTKTNTQTPNPKPIQYKKLDELTFADLYVETPDYEYVYMRQASRQALRWLHEKGKSVKHWFLAFPKPQRHHPRHAH